MNPAARIQALIELAEDIALGGAADAATSAYFRARRYIGAKDRAWLAEQIYAHLRRRARLEWWVNRVLERPAAAPPPAARHRVIADLLLAQRWSARDFASSFDGDKHHAAPLSRAERLLVEQLAGQPLDHAEQPADVRGEYPAWLEPELTRFAGGDATVLAKLNEPAPLDLRVNTLSHSRETVQQHLAASGIKAEPTPWSPLGLRVEGRPALGRDAAFLAGEMEIQDEGSQLVALLVDARPGLSVLDYCAGAGGKTLALAAAMRNKGRLVASDISSVRLDRAVKRLRRAGIHNVERRPLGPEQAGWFKRQAGRFDRVLVDAPCSGTGTWRRNPDMKWKFSPADLEELATLQGDILAQAAKLVKPGGRLIYATCSLLPAENEQRIESFRETHPEFAVQPVGALWSDLLPGPCPVDGPYLRLDPAHHGTDGFFAAVLERRKTAPEKDETSSTTQKEPSPPLRGERAGCGGRSARRETSHCD
jgi:16S rRNA (cytosine967-C5)-methyltransferase